MNYNIINEYISFFRKEYLEFFKIVLRNKYQKNLCLPFIDKYINVRYYNETDYPKEKDVITRINKELVALAEKLATDDNIETVKNIVALFGYIAFFDDVSFVLEDLEVINNLVNDDIIKIDNREGLGMFLKEWYIDLKRGKDILDRGLETKEFNLIEERLYRKLYQLVITQNVKISNLYSEFAIQKAFDSGVVNEDKLFICYILASSIVLNNAINMDFSRYYVVPFAGTLFTKERKLDRLFGIINNQLAKKFIFVRIVYSDYIKHKDKVNDLINQGYSFAIELDSKYTGDIRELILFPYVLVDTESPEYEMLEREKEHLKSKIVKL